MRNVVLLIVREDNKKSIATYVGLSSHKHIYGRLLTKDCGWPEYIRLKRSMSEATFDKNGNYTIVRQLLVSNSKPMKFSKSFMELSRSNDEDISYIEEIDKAVESGFYTIGISN